MYSRIQIYLMALGRQYRLEHTTICISHKNQCEWGWEVHITYYRRYFETKFCSSKAFPCRGTYLIIWESWQNALIVCLTWFLTFQFCFTDYSCSSGLKNGCAVGSCYDDGVRSVTFWIVCFIVERFVTFCWYRLLLRDLSLFVEIFNVDIFLNECLWYDKFWGPSRRVVTLLISLHTYAWLEMVVNIKQFVSVAVNRRMAAWGPCIILTQHYPANITISF